MFIESAYILDIAIAGLSVSLPKSESHWRLHYFLPDYWPAKESKKKKSIEEKDGTLLFLL